MNKVLVIYDGTTQVYSVDEDRSAQFIAESLNVTDPAFYQEFPESDFDADCYNFTDAFTLNAGVVGFDLDAAKTVGKQGVQSQSDKETQSLFKGYDYATYVYQCSLPEADRIPSYNTLIQQVNQCSIDCEAKKVAIDTATTIQEVNTIVFTSQS
jgi:hypothetical protein